MKQSKISRFFVKPSSSSLTSIPSSPSIIGSPQSPSVATKSNLAHTEVIDLVEPIPNSTMLVDLSEDSESIFENFLHHNDELDSKEEKILEERKILDQSLCDIFDKVPDVSSSHADINIKNTPLEQQVIEIRRNFPDCILMIECGYRMRFFGNDAIVASKCLGIYCHRDHNFMVASIPTFRTIIHARRLVSKGNKVAIVRQTETASLKKISASKNSTFRREVAGIFSPGSEVDDDDPAFQGLIANQGKSEDVENESDDETNQRDDDVVDDLPVDSEFNENNDEKWVACIHEHRTDLQSSLSIFFLNIQGCCVHFTDLLLSHDCSNRLVDELDMFKVKSSFL